MSDTDRQLLLVLQDERDRYKTALERISIMPLTPNERNFGTREMKNIANCALQKINSRKTKERR